MTCKDLEEFQGVVNMKDVLDKRPSMTPISEISDSFNSALTPNFFVEKLSQDQKDRIPAEHQQQFLKISGNAMGVTCIDM
jgi:hypothetical protein